MRLGRLVIPVVLAVLPPACSGPPKHVAQPPPPPSRIEREADPPERDARDFEDGIDVRIGIQWDRRALEFGGVGTSIRPPEGAGPVVRTDASQLRAEVARDGVTVRILDEGGSPVWQGAGPVAVEPNGEGRLQAGELTVRGSLELSARADSLFVVNVVPLEDYLRGVVPKEIGPRPIVDLEAVAAQAVAARTYTVKRLDQYNSLPFDLFADVQDQVYAGVGGEDAVADEAIRKTRGKVLADREGLIEAYYSSTCGGKRSDIAAVWPHRETNGALRGGSDGPRGEEWCRSSRHFTWEESWSGVDLADLVRGHLPTVLELAPGSVRGDLLDVKVVERGPSGRIAMAEYRTSNGTWRVPGDKNRWILRRPDGSILRSVFVELRVQRDRGKVVRVTAEGRGNGHGVGMCQVGALGRAEGGQGWWEILRSYYPGVRIRPLQGTDLPPGRASGA